MAVHQASYQVILSRRELRSLWCILVPRSIVLLALICGHHRRHVTVNALASPHLRQTWASQALLAVFGSLINELYDYPLWWCRGSMEGSRDGCNSRRLNEVKFSFPLSGPTVRTLNVSLERQDVLKELLGFPIVRAWTDTSVLIVSRVQPFWALRHRQACGSILDGLIILLSLASQKR